MNRIRGVNSLLDFDIDYNAERRQYMATKTLDQTLESIRPRYQRDNDVVLLLDIKTKGSYWFVKQGVFWSDSYAEAFALSRRGDDFLEDRKHFYALVDRVPMMTTEKWLSKKRVTLLVDQRPGGDDFLESLVHEMGLPYQRIEPGVWRLQEPKTNS